MIVVAAVVVTAGLAAAYYFHARNTAPASVPVAARPTPAPEAEPAIQHPVPGAAAGATGPLPPLNESDGAIKDALSGLGAGAARYLVPEDIVRHIVVTVDNLPRQKLAVAKRPAAPA